MFDYNLVLLPAGNTKVNARLMFLQTPLEGKTSDGRPGWTQHKLRIFFPSLIYQIPLRLQFTSLTNSKIALYVESKTVQNLAINLHQPAVIRAQLINDQKSNLFSSKLASVPCATDSFIILSIQNIPASFSFSKSLTFLLFMKHYDRRPSIQSSVDRASVLLTRGSSLFVQRWRERFPAITLISPPHGRLTWKLQGPVSAFLRHARAYDLINLCNVITP